MRDRRNVTFSQKEEAEEITYGIAFRPTEVCVRQFACLGRNVQQQGGDRIGDGSAHGPQDFVVANGRSP